MVEVQSKTPDPRIAAWKGQQMRVLMCAYANCTAYQNETAGEQFRAAALEMVIKMDYCVLAENNLVSMKVGAGRLGAAGSAMRVHRRQAAGLGWGRQGAVPSAQSTMACACLLATPHLQVHVDEVASVPMAGQDAGTSTPSGALGTVLDLQIAHEEVLDAISGNIDFGVYIGNAAAAPSSPEEACPADYK